MANKVDTVGKKIVRCIGTSDSHNTEVTAILRRYWPILLADNDLREVLNEYLTITYRRGHNLREHLVHRMYQEERKETLLNLKLEDHIPAGIVASANSYQE